jgi:hypothetical protein
VRLTNGSGEQCAGRREQPRSAAAAERHISSIFANLGHNEHSKIHTAERPLSCTI